MIDVRRRRLFLGVPVDLLDMAATRQAIADHVASGVPAAHLGVNAANLVLATDDAAYAADLAAADIVTADGQSVVWGARLFGIKVPERVTGIDLMQATLEDARTHGWGVYLVGARPEVVGRLAGLLAERGVRVAGHRDGYFGVDEEERVALDIRDSGATLLYVGMPSPRKERFIVGVTRVAGVPFSIGVGGSFDVLAGDLRRAPRAVQIIGLEWVFRLLQEPRRLLRRYAVTNARFLWLMVVAAARRRRRMTPWR